MTRDDILSLVASRPWFHSYDLMPGIRTPGLYRVDARAWVEEQFPGTDLSGKRFLEIGTWDGPYAFALEERGAIVHATDIQDPDATGFNVAKTILDSRVEYTRTSVYDVGRHFAESSFDYILFLGVFYHLKYPVLALEALSRVLKVGGALYFEGECLLNYATTSGQREAGWIDRLMLKHLARAGYPISMYYSGPFKDDSSNWHVPSVACLHEWMQTAGLDVEAQTCTQAARGAARFPEQRAAGVARKVQAVCQEHPMVENIAAVLEQARLDAARRARAFTVRSAASRAVNRVLAPLGLRQAGGRISRSQSRTV